MFRKYLYELIGDEHKKDAEMCREYEDWSDEQEHVSKAAFMAGFDAALEWVEEIIMKRTTEEKEQYQKERR